MSGMSHHPSPCWLLPQSHLHVLHSQSLWLSCLQILDTSTQFYLWYLQAPPLVPGLEYTLEPVQADVVQQQADLEWHWEGSSEV